MQGKHGITSSSEAKALQNAGLGRLFAEAKEGVDHHVADQKNPIGRNSFGSEIAHAACFAGEEVLRERTSVTSRLSSSGILRSKLRRPASTCAIGIPNCKPPGRRPGSS